MKRTLCALFALLLLCGCTPADVPVDGRINAIAAVGMGQVRISGMVSQVDNINRILDRVAIYLA